MGGCCVEVANLTAPHVVSAQVTRSVLGCLLTNFFRSWLTVKVQVNREPKHWRESSLYVFAQVSYDLFSFYSSLTDTYLLLSQADITLITLITTCLADGMSTVYFCTPRPPKEQLLRRSMEDKALLGPPPSAAAAAAATLGVRRLDARPGGGASAWFAL